MNDIEKQIFYYIMDQGKETKLYNKDCKYLKLGKRKLYAYYVTCEYIQGQDEDGNWIIDPQDEAALYLEKEDGKDS